MRTIPASRQHEVPTFIETTIERSQDNGLNFRWQYSEVSNRRFVRRDEDSIALAIHSLDRWVEPKAKPNLQELKRR